jgi:hypothetical protein
MDGTACASLEVPPIGSDVLAKADEKSEGNVSEGNVSLDSDAWGQVFAMLPAQELLKSVPLVCTRWHQRAQRSWLWKPHVQRADEIERKSSTNGSLDWRKVFISQQRQQQVQMHTQQQIQQRAAERQTKPWWKKELVLSMLSALAFLTAVLLTVLCVTPTSLPQSSARTHPDEVVHCRAAERFQGSKVHLQVLPHAGHPTEPVHGFLLRVEHAATDFHVFGPGHDPRCAPPLPTHVAAKLHHCRWATNGGLFSSKSGVTLESERVGQDGTATEDDGALPCSRGFFVSNGTAVGSGTGFPEFGLTATGDWIVGTFSVAEALSLGVRESVNGKGWLVRNGVSVAERHTPVTAHTTIGVSANGTLLLLEVDGCRESGFGRDAVGMAELLIKHGALHAIDLDGDGSSTVVEQARVINHPTGLEHWEPAYERPVESIVCIT